MVAVEDVEDSGPLQVVKASAWGLQPWGAGGGRAR